MARPDVAYPRNRRHRCARWVFSPRPLTLQQAADESGFSYGHMQRLVSEGELENVGAPGSPRVRRGDLPRKPCRPENGQAELADEILARRTGR